MAKKTVVSPDTSNLNKDIIKKLPDSATIVIFGASGDLTERKLIPSLFRLDSDGLLPEKCIIVGVARTEMDSESFRKKIKESVGTYSRHYKDRCGNWSAFEKKLIYHRMDYDNLDDYKSLNKLLIDLNKKQGMISNCLFYLSTPPMLYPGIVTKLGEAGMAQQSDEFWRRIIIEKPFGRDLASAVDLNSHIHQVFNESQVYRIDHYLGKETVQNLFVFRFGNAIFEPLWNRNYIDHVQITVSEEVSLGSRAGYYDTAGVLRDMFQNHLLQLLTLTAMEPPAEFNATSLRDEKVKVLKAVRPIKPEEVARHTVRAQYRTYRDEKGVTRGTETATFAVLKLFIDNWRWRNVPFYLRSGKALDSKVTEISIQFRHVPHLMFPLPPEELLPPNKLILCLQPNEGMRLGFETKLPGAGMKTRTVSMDFLYEQDFGENILPDAYERLILDALQGDASLFTRSDEIELAWKIIDPILKGWESEYAPPLSFYELGTCGPSKAEEFIQADGRKWNPCM